MQQWHDMLRFRWGVLAILLCVAAKTAFAAPTISVVFVGNSLTQANDLPEVSKRFAAASPLHIQIEVHSTTPGGAFLYDNWKRGEAIALLRQYHPRFFILQGQSTEPLSAQQSFIYYAGLFKAAADRENAVTVLFSTWARPAGDAYYRDPTSGGSPPEMQTRLNSGYATLSEKLGARLAPIGVAWQTAHGTAPAIQLLDGTQHPSVAGTYLTAAVLFRTLFSTAAASSTYYDSLPKETALTLQSIANAVPISNY